MIAGIFHQGSGLGNQLHRYVATRVLAADKGYEWGMENQGWFKGDSFMSIEKGSEFVKDSITGYILHQVNIFLEKKVVENGVDVRGYDPEINFVKDNTIIDGEFQDPRYFEHRMNDITDWLKVEPLYVRPDTCVIGFRGGEYSVFPDLYLTQDYWDDAIMVMRGINKNMKFEVHTDDPIRAEEMLKPLFERRNLKVSYIHDIGINWRSTRYAKYAIIANSSFYILPRLLRHHGQEAITIAPQYWARRNTKVWALPQNYYKQFIYI